MSASLLRHILPYSRRRRRWPLQYSLLPLAILSLTVANSLDHSNNQFDPFPGDILTPYPEGRHGGTRTTREISSCQHTRWENRTVETFKVLTTPPSGDGKLKFKMHKYADVVARTPLRKRYAVGTITFIEDPYFTLSVLEPSRKGTCHQNSYYTTKATVLDTAANYKHGCRLAANGGYFTVSNGNCLGNIVSDGRLVKSANGVQNANFGIKEDGSIVVGYIPEEELHNQTNPFRQLVTGVIWLVRNGTNYVNESKVMECSDHEDTGPMDTFVNVISARSAIGHDDKGRVVLARVEGQTHVRGANLYEFADVLIKRGVVNAINLDGGGSNTLVQDGILLNYPSDHCDHESQYRCARKVSTVICVHDVQCLEPDCNNHGSCDMGACSCESPWTGDTCGSVNCSLTDCNGHGICMEGSCTCDPGWTGELCQKPCPRNRYGFDCRSYCYCYGRGRCHPVYGNCTCDTGYTGAHCWTKCKKGYYGVNCAQKCMFPDCSGNGHCSILNGSCLCNKGWTGISCNITLIENNQINTSSTLFITSSSSSLADTPDASTAVPVMNSISSLLSPTNDVSLQDITVLNNDNKSIDSCNGTTTSSSPPVNYSANDDDNQLIIIIILIGLSTVTIHVILCAVHICCHGNGEIKFNKSEIKRELMERREWEQIMLQNSNWNSSTDED
ncbi:PREDICTED: N-acetylglucosamine-1-phosphodiester alpha-N-acetylglucosaminidase-like isoform X2 [Amphimedon queenslandica]|uniref:EGF-like domain-containing protein n=1 Tax=Amphimedon queenslandica TaxID=400682 RepID=A0AAN0JR87_AMPQE|nr:PREDICTED: N-acetylglucosamine-1-phosphodiester alpha-N-acetylglucosaminidase-like isoform X2 [Amphimedon queenslandica]|eukprot:XP_019859514.1 PREDICTED: N-acetylglucosamine-1-phosphodiester alpha-N-acetylglucosaminidase-like isoform X2 [Amphimedon queenslandica]